MNPNSQSSSYNRTIVQILLPSNLPHSPLLTLLVLATPLVACHNHCIYKRVDCSAYPNYRIHTKSCFLHAIKLSISMYFAFGRDA